MHTYEVVLIDIVCYICYYRSNTLARRCQHFLSRPHLSSHRTMHLRPWNSCSTFCSRQCKGRKEVPSQLQRCQSRLQKTSITPSSSISKVSWHDSTSCSLIIERTNKINQKNAENYQLVGIFRVLFSFMVLRSVLAWWTLYCRHVSMLSSILSGRVHFTYGEFIHQNYLLLHTNVLGLVELLQPHIFVHKDFPAIVDAFFSVIGVSDNCYTQ